MVGSNTLNISEIRLFGVIIDPLSFGTDTFFSLSLFSLSRSPLNQHEEEEDVFEGPLV